MTDSPLDLSGVAEFANSLMTDECVIFVHLPKERADGSNFNEETGTYTSDEPGRSFLYQGPCMIYNRAPSNAHTVEEGGQSRSRQQWYASLPTDRADFVIPPDAILTVTAVGPDSDPSLLERQFTVEASDGGTHIATRELALEEERPNRR